jgi:hypothetical protein
VAQAPWPLGGAGPILPWRRSPHSLAQVILLGGAGLIFWQGPAPLYCTGWRNAAQVLTFFADLRQRAMWQTCADDSEGSCINSNRVLLQFLSFIMLANRLSCLSEVYFADYPC